MTPRVSVITPCHNDGHYLERNIESVRRSGSDYEHVIVDDGSTDLATLDLLSRIGDDRVRVFHKPCGGPASARNYGVARARGRYLLNLDADDMATAVPFTAGAQLLDEDPQVDVVFGDYETFGAVARVIRTSEFCPFRLLFRNCVGVGSLYRRSAWTAAQGYAENGMIYEDWHFWLKVLAQGGGFRHVDGVFFRYFVRSSGKSFADDRRYLTGFRQIRESLPELYAPDNLRQLARSSGVGRMERLYLQYLMPLVMRGRRTAFGKRLSWLAATHIRRSPLPSS